MCGIAVILGLMPPDQVESSLRTMLDAQIHRGPDDGGWTVVQAAQSVLGMGTRRLAIQDISALGHQPMRNEDTGDILVYNGEIYNTPRLKALLASEGYRFRGHCDTEVLLRAYEEWGIECLDRLRGMFAFAIWDTRRERLIVARDHLGIKPLYYCLTKCGFACASEIRALARSGLISSIIDRRALAGYLAYGGIQEPLTIFENVYSLPRGSWREVDCSGKIVTEGKYWRFPPVQHSIAERPSLSIAEEGRALLQQSVHNHLLSDVRLGVFLSSGLDSTAILGLSQAGRNNGIDAFTVTFPDRPQCSEHQQARDTAARFKARFHECQVSDSTALSWIDDALGAMDQPSMDGFNTYVVARAVREQGIVVALSGLGGDEIFGGYDIFRRVPWSYNAMTLLGPLPRSLRLTAAWLATISASRVAKRKAIEIASSDSGLIGLYFHYRRLVSNLGLRMLGLDARELGLSEDFQIADLRYEDSFVPSDHVASVGRLDASFYLQNILLRDSDAFGMANSLEIRVPFLDRDLVEWAFRLPGRVILPSGAPPKQLLRKICTDLYTKPQMRQPKRGFVLPFNEWMMGSLRELTEENIRFLRSCALIDQRGIDKLQKLFHDEPRGPGWSRVWALTSLGHWLRNNATSCSNKTTTYCVSTAN